MAKFANSVCFLPTAGGTADFTVSSAVTGFMTPALAGMASGTYKYRAESSNLSEWEIGEGVYTSGTGVFTRTTVLYNSSGTGTASGQSGAGSKVNFSAPPNVGVVQLVEDTLGIDQANNWVDTQKTQARDNLGVSKKNRIVNSAVMISQEKASVGTSASGGYPVDMFMVSFSGTVVFTSAQVASVTPAGSPNRIRTTITTADASIAAADYLCLLTKIEGYRVADLMWGTANAKTITISFGVKAPAGTYSISVRNAANNRSYVADFVISGGEADTDVRKTIVVPGDTSGTWEKTTSIGISISWTLTTGSNYQATTGSWQAGNYLGSASTSNFSGVVSNVFELFDIQLCEGVTVPPFEVPEFVDELEQCRRYYHCTYPTGTPIATATYTNSIRIFAPATGNYTVVASLRLARPMRVAPTVTIYSPYNGAAGYIINSDLTLNVPGGVSVQGDSGLMVYVNNYSVSQSQGLGVHLVLDARL